MIKQSIRIINHNWRVKKLRTYVLNVRLTLACTQHSISRCGQRGSALDRRLPVGLLSLFQIGMWALAVAQPLPTSEVHPADFTPLIEPGCIGQLSMKHAVTLLYVEKQCGTPCFAPH
jgi:hypothetical protein